MLPNAHFSQMPMLAQGGFKCGLKFVDPGRPLDKITLGQHQTLLQTAINAMNIMTVYRHLAYRQTGFIIIILVCLFSADFSASLGYRPPPLQFLQKEPKPGRGQQNFERPLNPIGIPSKISHSWR